MRYQQMPRFHRRSDIRRGWWVAAIGLGALFWSIVALAVYALAWG